MEDDQAEIPTATLLLQEMKQKEKDVGRSTLRKQALLQPAYYIGRQNDMEKRKGRSDLRTRLVQAWMRTENTSAVVLTGFR